MKSFRIVKYLNIETGVEKFAIEKFWGFLGFGFWTSYPFSFMNVLDDTLHLYDSERDAKEAFTFSTRNFNENL